MASRTEKALKNSRVALIIYIINLFLQFYSRKVFLEYLGKEVLGLNTTISNIISYLNLAEMGLASAVAFSLYRPLLENNKTELNEIITFQGLIYKRIAVLIIIGSIIIMAFLPVIFQNDQLPLWYAYIAFIAFLVSSLLGYFVNYKQVILSAAQLQYKIAYSYKGMMILKILAQIVIIQILPSYAFISWILMEVCFSILASVALSHTTIKSFPFLKKVNKSFHELRSKYTVIEKKIKQLFFHQSAYIAISQSAPIIIYAYGNLTEVTYYQNYIIIYLGIISLVSSLFNGIRASIGNLNAESPDRLFCIFKEDFVVRFLMSSILCYMFYLISSYFIYLWIGDSYVLNNTTVILISIMLFLSLMREGVNNYIYAIGLFGDIASPIIEICLNLGLSIILGKYYGLDGIITGTIITQFVIGIAWKHLYLFKNAFKLEYKIFLKMSLRCGISVFIAIYIYSKSLNYVTINTSGWIGLMGQAIIYFVSFSILQIIVMLVCRTELGLFFRRLKTFVK